MTDLEDKEGEVRLNWSITLRMLTVCTADCTSQGCFEWTSPYYYVSFDSRCWTRRRACPGRRWIHGIT